MVTNRCLRRACAVLMGVLEEVEAVVAVFPRSVPRHRADVAVLRAVLWQREVRDRGDQCVRQLPPGICRAGAVEWLQ